MRPLAIDFAPRRSLPHRAVWLAGGAVALLVATSGIAWLTASPVEASHMAMVRARILPDAAQAQIVDAAVRTLNLPWIEALDALAETLGQDGNAVLLDLEADAQRALVRVSGAARTSGAVQSLPARLRAAGPFSTATLISQELREGTVVLPMHFVIELNLKETP